MSRAEREREDGGRAVHRNWCAVFVKGRCVLGNIFKLNRWRKKEENEQSCHWHRLITFSRQEKADTISFLIRRDDGQSQTRVTCL